MYRLIITMGLAGVLGATAGCDLTSTESSDDSKIINGSDAAIEDYPWHVTLFETERKYAEESPEGKVVEGYTYARYPEAAGIVLNETTVLTAGHVLSDMFNELRDAGGQIDDGTDTPIRPTDYLALVAGTAIASAQNFDIDQIRSDTHQQSFPGTGIESIRFYPGFDVCATNGIYDERHDLAIVKLDPQYPFDLGDTEGVARVRAAKLPSDINDLAALPESLFAIGAGMSEVPPDNEGEFVGVFPGRLQELRVRQTPELKEQGLLNEVEQQMLVVEGDSEGSSPCYADSGSGLSTQRGEEGRVVGVLSRRLERDDDRACQGPAVYTPLVDPEVLAWIETQMADETGAAYEEPVRCSAEITPASSP